MTHTAKEAHEAPQFAGWRASRIVRAHRERLLRKYAENAMLVGELGAGAAASVAGGWRSVGPAVSHVHCAQGSRLLRGDGRRHASTEAARIARC
jgi:hypothetical protein